MDGMKKVFFSTMIAIGLVGAGALSLNLKNENFQARHSLEEVREGVNVCFARLQQTYTSVYISPNLSYLAVDFLKTTESCFAQALAVAVDARIENSAEIEKLINRLGNYARLFHAGVKNKSLFSKGKSDYSVANSRFMKLEETRDEILNGLDRLGSQVKTKDQNFNVITYSLFAGALIGLFGILYFDGRTRLRRNHYRAQIIESLRSDDDKKADTGQAFYKAMKYFDVQVGHQVADKEIKIEKAKTEALNTKSKVTEGSQKSEPLHPVFNLKNLKPVLPVINKPKKEVKKEESIKVTMGDILGEILLEYSPDILSQKISTKFNELEEVELKGNTTRLYHLMKFIFGILVKSEFQGAPYIHLHVEKKNSPVIRIKTNSIFSQFENSTSQGLFARATESFSDEFDLTIGEGSDGVNSISIKQKKTLVKVFKGTKRQFLDSQSPRA